MKRSPIIRLMTALAVIPLLVSCAREVKPKTYTQQAKEAQIDVMEAAIAAEPPYQPNEFTTRAAINRSLKANETSPWFVYALTFSGDPLFYIVSNYRPQNRCHSITNPDVYYRGNMRKAPAVDGVFYSPGGCHSWHVTDITTGGLIELSGTAFTIIASEHPLPIETDRLIPKPLDE